MKRDNFNQLPDLAELKNILSVEAKRDFPEGKDQEHYFDFSPIEKLISHFGLSDDFLRASFTQQDIAEHDLFRKGKMLIESLKQELLPKELDAEVVKKCNAVYDYLAEEDVPEKVDLIFVFGAKTLLRIEKAIEIYKLGLSDKILISGRGPYYAENQSVSEADIYRRIAMEQGIPSSALITEEESITIPDNVRSSLNLLDDKRVAYSSLILVNSPYVQRRGYAHFKKYLPDTVKLIRVNSGTGDQYKRDTWYKNEAGIDTVLSEYIKAKVAVSLNTA